MDLQDALEFVVGAEKRLVDVLDEPQILPLLKSAVKVGIAHEINNPLGFNLSNLHTFEKYLGRLTAML